MKVTRSQLWRGIGYGLTAAWMIGILIVSDSNPAHPWFNYIFVVPLIGWIIGIGIARFLVPPGGPKVPPVDPSPRQRPRRED